MTSKATLPALLLLTLLPAAHAPAMTFHDFARMNNDDDATYVAQLVEGASEILKKEGQPAQAARVIALFKDAGKEGGVNQFAMNVKTLNALNDRNAINPNNRAPVYEIEDAMALTLKDNGIVISVAALHTINEHFMPVGPPRGLAPVPAPVPQ